jgi:hypothetical protein
LWPGRRLFLLFVSMLVLFLMVIVLLLLDHRLSRLLLRFRRLGCSSLLSFGWSAGFLPSGRGRRVVVFNLFLLAFVVRRFGLWFRKLVFVAAVQHGHGFLDKVANLIVATSFLLIIGLKGLQAVAISETLASPVGPRRRLR